MGVTTEIYRSQIGAHKNYMESKKNLCYFHGQVWNELLLKFYINLVLPPDVKCKLNMMQTNNTPYNIHNIVHL